MTKLPISVFIIAKNEEDRIPPVVRSVIDWVDEVIVVDSGSEDNTITICENLGARVLFNGWQGYGQQKCFAEELCRNDWVLNIDADETVSSELRAEITRLIHADNIQHNGYHIPIRIVSRFQKRPALFAPSNDPVRFYNKKHAGFKDSSVHDSVVVHDGTTGKLKGHLIHNCFRSYKHAIEKINFYSSMQAEDMFTKGRNPNPIRIIIEPFFAFLKAYTLRRYCFLGVDGFIESVIYAFARTIRLAKARELFKEHKN